jgi:uncharacterized protein YybS (DUF2232 family)
VVYLETKELIEGALLVAFTAVIIIIGFFLPLVGNFLLIISPLPIIVAVIRWNSRLGIITSLASGIILLILINPGLFLFAIFYTGLLGVSLGSAFEEQFKPKIILGIGTIATAVAFSLNLFVIKYILHIDIIAQLEEQMKLVTATYQELGFSQEVISQVSEQLMRTLQTTFPVLILSSGLLIAGINYYVSTKVLARLDVDYPYQLQFEKFKIAKVFAIIYLVAIIFSANSPNPVLENIYLLITFLFSLQGVAVIYHYYLAEQVKKIYLIVGLIFFPIVVNLLFFVGIFDLWFDFRNLDDA